MSRDERAMADQTRLAKLAPMVARSVMPDVLAREERKRVLLAIPVAARTAEEEAEVDAIIKAELLESSGLFSPTVPIEQLRAAYRPQSGPHERSPG